MEFKDSQGKVEEKAKSWGRVQEKVVGFVLLGKTFYSQQLLAQ